MIQKAIVTYTKSMDIAAIVMTLAMTTIMMNLAMKRKRNHSQPQATSVAVDVLRNIPQTNHVKNVSQPRVAKQTALPIPKRK